MSCATNSPVGLDHCLLQTEIAQTPIIEVLCPHENRKVILDSHRTVVLLKHGVMEAVECLSDEIFLLARVRGAGICGVFDDQPTAERYIQKHALPMGSQSSPGKSKAILEV